MISAIQPTNGTLDGGYSVTLLGSNLAADASDVVELRVGSTQLTAGSYSVPSSSQVVFVAPPQNRSQTVTVSLRSQVFGSVNTSFTYVPCTEARRNGVTGCGSPLMWLSLRWT